MPKPRCNYISNPVLLEEIHKSKLSYCDLAPDHDGSFHLIADTLPDPTEGLIVRVMTREHIPPDYAEDLRFLPFLHYQCRAGAWVEVCRSHYRKGQFRPKRGNVTDKLAKAMLMLAQRYSRKAGFAGYSYRDEFEAAAVVALVTNGLKFNEAKGNNPMAYLTQIAHNAIIAVLNKEARAQRVRDELLVAHGCAPSLAYQLRAEETEEARVASLNRVEPGQ